MNTRPLPFPLLSSCAALGIVVCFCQAAALGAETPDGPVAAVQESLQRQQYYTGRVNGTYDESTRAAVRRFQIRHGLKVTGELDATTLEELAAGERALQGQPTDVPPPQEVPARERARQVVRDDQEFLEQVEATEEPKKVAKEPPPLDAARTAPPPAPIPRIPVVRDRVEEVRPPAERVAPPKPETREPREREEESAPAQAGEISAAQARHFVEDYLQATQSPTPEREVSFYGEEVNYFDEGRIPRAAVARDQRGYYRRWPDREFTLVDEPEVLRTSRDGATVRYRVHYQLRSDKDSARGETENVVGLRREGDHLRIVSIRERKLR